jgi:hypothetical protein
MVRMPGELARLWDVSTESIGSFLKRVLQAETIESHVQVVQIRVEVDIRLQDLSS